MAFLVAIAAAVVAYFLAKARAPEVLVVLTIPIGALVAAWFGGLGPGLVAGVVGVVASAILVFPPIGSFAIASTRDRVAVFAEGVLSLALAVSVGAMKHARRADASITRAVAKSEARYRLIFERNPDPIAILDPDTLRILSVNQAAIDKYGYTREELLEMRGFDLRYPEDVPLALADLERRPAPDDGDVFRPAIFRQRTKSGVPIYVDVSASSLDIEGRPRLLVIARDITAQVRATDAMRDAEEKWHALLESESDCFLVIDGTDNIDFASRDLLDMPALALRNASVVARVAPDDRSPLRKTLESVRRSGETAHLDLRILRKNATTSVLHEARCLPVKRRGETSLVLLILTDVSRRREEEAHLRTSKEGAEAASRAKDRFIAALSHELRRPLTPALAAASLAKTRYPEASELLDVIQRNVETEAHLIDDLLEVSQIVNGRRLGVAELFDIHRLLESVAVHFQPEARAKDIRLEVDLRATAHWVRADPARIDQALLNIARNAVRASRPRGTVRIESKDSAPGHIAVVISNTGRGFSPEDLSRVFVPFEQDRSWAGDGLGLGLTISKGIVDAAGGTLTATSAGPEGGGAFTVDLEASVELPGAKPDVPARAPPATAAVVGHPRVLLVEDDVDTRDIVAELLRELDYDVKTASNVASALRAFQDGEVDLVISDIGLPDGTGLDLLGSLTKRRPVRAIALSGYGMADDVSRSKAAGFMAHLTKPVSLEQLTETIRDVMA
jgi:PAS domain S-box-containing protein